jgi:purine-nucleoside phosphorylase
MADTAAALIRAHRPGFTPAIAVVLGSGLGGLAERLQGPSALSYAELPGFPMAGVAGHAGRLVLGESSGRPVALLQGRAHFYESGRADVMRPVIEALAALGCPALLLTCAAGSLRAEAGPGSLVSISDHIGLAGASPLIGETGPRRFLDMSEAYDPGLRGQLRQAAARAGVALHEGVYAWFGGPQFETPAEIRAARLLGADLAGMSVAPEVILARHAGLKVAALAVVTNLGAGMGPDALHHGQTLDAAARAMADLTRLLDAFFAGLAEAS